MHATTMTLKNRGHSKANKMRLLNKPHLLSWTASPPNQRHFMMENGCGHSLKITLLLCYLYKLHSDQMLHFLGKILEVWSKDLQEVIERSWKEVREKCTKIIRNTQVIFIRFSGVGENSSAGQEFENLPHDFIFIHSKRICYLLLGLLFSTCFCK